MRFERILTHRCTIVLTGQKIGETEYGKPIYRDVPIGNVPCRADQIRRKASVDQYGVDFIIENILFVGPDKQIPSDAKIKDIRDLKDRPVLDGVYTVEKAQPIYSKVRLHHYEVTLQKESDGNG
ncbi:YqbH/XkdH family protein [Priestia sp. JV24]|uniref:YqbH/XkdH family protein n=1 Tax=Priestia TaxID=2800373 RepID=UPI0021D68A37|nr:MULTISPECIES: YqbH/XkdH family protein [Priestia]MCU7712473.1 YqbH/XkdH family protein [Priestia megaterium]MCW1046302.1 YqbH/XkdH family protein [Priestia sp. JV24]